MDLNNNQPYGVFDLDGTLIRWQLYHAISQVLIDHRLLSTKHQKSIQQAKDSWQNRRSHRSFNEYENVLIDSMNQTLPGINKNDFEKICQLVFMEYKDQVHSLILDLINHLKKQNYFLICISGSPEPIVKLIANYYHFNDYAGSSLIYQDNLIHDYGLIMTGQEKLLALNNMIKKHHLSQNNSYGVGDTLGDQYILNFVQKPIAFNPNQELYELAVQKHWTIMIERKNVQYQLNYLNDHYELAKTIRY